MEKARAYFIHIQFLSVMTGFSRPIIDRRVNTVNLTTITSHIQLTPTPLALSAATHKHTHPHHTESHASFWTFWTDD